MPSWIGWTRSSDGEEDPIASVTIKDVEYEIYSIDQLTFDEQSTLKKLTGGMSLRKLAEGIDEMDVDAWRGVILVSIQKQNPRFVASTLGSLNMVDLIQAINDDDEAETEAEVEESPPPVATPSVAEPLTGSTSSSAGAETPETSGIPTSLGSST